MIFRSHRLFGIYILAVLVLAGCNQAANKKTSVPADQNVAVHDTVVESSHTIIKDSIVKVDESADKKIEVRVFEIEAGNGFGYDIYMNGRLYVHQPHIPAIAGNKNFSSKEDAQKTGDFAANKIRNNIMPPSITVEELDSLGVSI